MEIVDVNVVDINIYIASYRQIVSNSTFFLTLSISFENTEERLTVELQQRQSLQANHFYSRPNL